jgi:hypothetical protein
VQTSLLDSNPDARLRVYAVWYNMFPGDSREKWPANLLTDPRVAHYWDERKLVGTTYFQNLPQIWERRAPDTAAPSDLILWDAYLLYEPKVLWDDAPPSVVSWGSTILQTQDRLVHDLEPVLH